MRLAPAPLDFVPGLMASTCFRSGEHRWRFDVSGDWPCAVACLPAPVAVALSSWPGDVTSRLSRVLLRGAGAVRRAGGTMSLSSHERHALDGISEGLTASDPVLAGLLDEFTRLNAGGGMPARERIGFRPHLRCTVGERRPAGSRHAGRPGRLACRAWIRILVLVLVLAFLISGAIAVGFATATPCTARQPSDCPFDPAPSAAAHPGPS